MSRPRHADHTPRAGFTLIELLVVITIVSLLVSILLPAMSAARENAKEVACRSNMRQVFIGDTVYQMDFRGWMPTQEYSEYIFGQIADVKKIREYWNGDVSWCPTIDRFDPGPVWGSPKWPQRNIWGDWGFFRPKYSSTIASIWMHEYTDSPSAKYIRTPDAMYLGYGTNWLNLVKVDVARSLPVTMDIVFSYPTVTSCQNSTSAHAPGATIRPNGPWVAPKGCNVFWDDGSVDFKKWDPASDPSVYEWIYIPTGQVTPEEGYTYLLSGSSQMLYVKRGIIH